MVLNYKSVCYVRQMRNNKHFMYSNIAQCVMMFDGGAGQNYLLAFSCVIRDYRDMNMNACRNIHATNNYKIVFSKSFLTGEIKGIFSLLYVHFCLLKANVKVDKFVNKLLAAKLNTKQCKLKENVENRESHMRFTI